MPRLCQTTLGTLHISYCASSAPQFGVWHVCWCEDSAPAGKCGQWALPPPGPLPLLSAPPVHSAPCVWTRSSSDLLRVTSTPSMSILSLLASITPNSNHLERREVKPPICVLKHAHAIAQSLKRWKLLAWCGRKNSSQSSFIVSQPLDVTCNVPKPTMSLEPGVMLGQLKSDYAGPEMISDHLWLTMTSARWTL